MNPRAAFLHEKTRLRLLRLLQHLRYAVVDIGQDLHD